MCALATASSSSGAQSRPASVAAVDPAPAFGRAVDALVERYTQLWRGSPSDSPVLGEPIPGRRKRRNHRRTKRLIDSLSKRAERWPDDEDQRRRWRAEIKAEVQLYGEECLGWPESYRNLVFGEDFYQTTLEFTRRARSLDPRIAPEALGQALRNVWIMSSVQMLLDLPVAISPSIFAYSMLYPYTDNYLDDPDVAQTEKVDFNRRLESRLLGLEQPEQNLDPRLRDIFRLVEMIESEHSRSDYPRVYSSLLAIHQAQVASLGQQSPSREPSSERLLAWSVRKGGTSVLADGFLVEPNLGADETSFFFGYGVFLQFLDDLQDVESDRAAGHATLFSTAAGHVPLDELASRLYHFVRSVLANSSRFAGTGYADRLDLIERNCVFLLVGAIADNRRLFSRRFVKTLETGWPLGFGSMRRLRRFASRRRRKATESLRKSGKVDSLLDLLG